MTMFFIGFGSAFIVSSIFMGFCVWYSRRFPPIRDEAEDTELATTRIYYPPSYGPACFGLMREEE